MNKSVCTAALLAAILLGDVTGLRAVRGEIVFSGSSITENFDSLGTTVFGNYWSSTVGVQAVVPGTTGFDGTKVAGSGTPSLVISDGSINTGAIHSFGAASGGTQGERALGAVASGTNVMGFGFSLVNSAPDVAITSITISFNQENWRTPNTTNNTLTAAWGTSATPGVTANNYLTAAGLSAVPTLNMSLAFTGSNTALDGNLLANRVAKSFTFSSLNLGLNDRFYLRWQDADEGGNDAGIGMDDMTLTFVTSAVPEAPAGALGVVATGAVAVGCAVRAGRAMWRRRTSL